MTARTIDRLLNDSNEYKPVYGKESWICIYNGISTFAAKINRELEQKLTGTMVDDVEYGSFTTESGIIIIGGQLGKREFREEARIT